MPARTDVKIRMCGIAGEVRFDGSTSNPAITKAMCDAQIHRGPDDEGYYANGPISLGIRRLAIIDLSKGLYPLHNETSTIYLVFNGEIYGFHKLRTQLEQHGHRFHTRTDAETVIHGYEEWGTRCLKRLNGMFAFALWDRTKQQLWIARDHFGIKPFYYHRNPSFFTFASEIRPLLTRPDLSVHPNEDTVRRYLRSGQVDNTEETFFRDINRLPPAHYLLIRPDGTLEREAYWKPMVSNRLDGGPSSDEIERIRNLFLGGITEQLVSDVPVGTCLSGGVDSSSIVCAIKKVYPQGAVSTGRRIKTFSAVFPGNPIDETEYAETVCNATGAEYNPVTPTADMLWRDLPSVVKCQEEPFISSSVYAQWRVMKCAKEHSITVMLDGQGGDELLSGYVPYYLCYLTTLAKHREYCRLLSEAVRSCDLTRPFIGNYLITLMVYGKTRVVNSLRNFSRRLTLCRVPEETTPQPSEAPLDDLATRLAIDTSIASLPALLRYEDKNSMSHSIEARVPFLSRQFFEYVASLPLDRKLRDGWTKYSFRLAMNGILPEKIRLRRSKIGFETPQKRWMERELRDRLKEFFSDRELKATKYYNAKALRTTLNKPKLTEEETNLIWRILNLELWWNEFFD
jgi:asparagine synthase (glutamine-hydrolysing)